MPKHHTSNMARAPPAVLSLRPTLLFLEWITWNLLPKQGLASLGPGTSLWQSTGETPASTGRLPPPAQASTKALANFTAAYSPWPLCRGSFCNLPKSPLPSIHISPIFKTCFYPSLSGFFFSPLLTVLNPRDLPIYLLQTPTHLEDLISQA